MKVLCVSPRFAPANSADHHRLRLLAPHLAELGCELHVLAVEPEDVGGPADASLLRRLPAGLPVHRVRAWPALGWGLRGLGQRALLPLKRAGDALLRQGGFDLIFFSTTDFVLHALGPVWRRRWGVPFCMDFQDPWVNDYYAGHPEVVPPGGRLKYGLKLRIDRVLERRVLRRCSGLLAVSAEYLDSLQRRHGARLGELPRLVAAFPGEPAEALPPRPTERVWRYIGRGGADMALAAGAFFEAWRAARSSGLPGLDGLRFEAIGTSYAPGAPATLHPLAAQSGLAACVTEQTGRLGYGEVLEKLASSEALVVFGSDDPAYTASKIYPYLLSGRPVLAIMHERSSVVPLVHAVGGAVLVTFGDSTQRQVLADTVLQAWFAAPVQQRAVPLDRRAFVPFTARAQAGQVLAWWQQVVVHGRA